jgi:cell division protein FtsB
MRKKRRKKGKANYFLIFPLVGVVIFLVFLNVNLYEQRKETRRQLQRVEDDLEVLMQRQDHIGITEEANLEKEVERIAREQLLLRKEGESVIIISREEKEKEEDDDDEKELEKEGFWDSLINAFKQIEN